MNSYDEIVGWLDETGYLAHRALKDGDIDLYVGLLKSCLRVVASNATVLETDEDGWLAYSEVALEMARER